ncbi:hypothetical protein LIER_42960 [Lithospermum erythrorhizon]|uniref:Uncharacterized protein n=1 Tax=Lithospermum erythrorhizon TaxID=34254 RepID=A0AAV3P7K2_LITER
MNLNGNNDHLQENDALNLNNPAFRQPEDAPQNVPRPINIRSGRTLPDRGKFTLFGDGRGDTRTHGANCGQHYGTAEGETPPYRKRAPAGQQSRHEVPAPDKREGELIRAPGLGNGYSSHVAEANRCPYGKGCRTNTTGN